MTVKKYLLLVVAIVIIFCPACSRTSEFDTIAKTCSEVTGEDIELSNAEIDNYSNGYHYTFFHNKSNYSNSSYQFSISSESMRIDLSEFGSGKKAREEWDSIEIRKDGDEEDTSPVVEYYFYEENKDNGYVVSLYSDWGTPNVIFNAEYLIGKDRLSFEISLYSDKGKEEYAKYLEICNRLNLYTSKDISDCIAETEFVY